MLKNKQLKDDILSFAAIHVYIGFSKDPTNILLNIQILATFLLEFLDASWVFPLRHDLVTSVLILLLLSLIRLGNSMSLYTILE